MMMKKPLDFEGDRFFVLPVRFLFFVALLLFRDVRFDFFAAFLPRLVAERLFFLAAISMPSYLPHEGLADTTN